VLSIYVALFWNLGQLIDVYQYAALGAVFEMLWFPVVLLTLILPFVCLFFIVKQKCNLKSFYVYSFLLVAATIAVMLLKG
jgi:hypothetical protein